MVAVHRIAVLHPLDTRRAPGPRSAGHRSAGHRSAGHRAASVDRPAQGRHLRLVGADEGARRRSFAGPVTTSPLSTLAVAAVMATVLLVVLVRGVQGAPPAADWNTLSASEPTGVIAGQAVAAEPVADETATGITITVQPDDTWASIAAALAPDADPVDIARQLASVNGGYRLEPGQVLAVPAFD